MKSIATQISRGVVDHSWCIVLDSVIKFDINDVLHPNIRLVRVHDMRDQVVEEVWYAIHEQVWDVMRYINEYT